jgi:hypothetical protein
VTHTSHAPPTACLCTGTSESLLTNTCSYRCTETFESPCITGSIRKPHQYVFSLGQKSVSVFRPILPDNLTYHSPTLSNLHFINSIIRDSQIPAVLTFFNNSNTILVPFRICLSMLVFWVVKPCKLAGRYQRFGETYCLHL